MLGEEHPSTLNSASNLAASLACQRKYAQAEEVLQAAWEVSRRVLGDAHPRTISYAGNLQYVRSAMHAEQPTKRGGKPAARRKERKAASPLSATALAEAEAKAGAAEAELLAMLEPEEGAAGSAKGKAKGNKGKRGSAAADRSAPLQASDRWAVHEHEERIGIPTASSCAPGRAP